MKNLIIAFAVCIVFLSSCSNPSVAPVNDNTKKTNALSVKNDTALILSIVNVQASVIGGTITVPINVAHFNNVGAISLKISYDPSVLKFIDIKGVPADTTIIGSGTPGVIYLDWFDMTAITPLNIGTGKLVDLNFTYLGGTSIIAFIPSACDIADGSALSYTNVIYFNGNVSFGKD
ncbi:MAG: cohesin domain-containing protein [Bacteroidota bacterium]